MKILVVLYISLPQIKGSKFLFSNFISPLFIQHEYEIDNQIRFLRKKATGFLAGKLEYLTSYLLLAATMKVK
jgi:hypothetical protein